MDIGVTARKPKVYIPVSLAILLVIVVAFALFSSSGGAKSSTQKSAVATTSSTPTSSQSSDSQSPTSTSKSNAAKSGSSSGTNKSSGSTSGNNNSGVSSSGNKSSGGSSASTGPLKVTGPSSGGGGSNPPTTTPPVTAPPTTTPPVTTPPTTTPPSNYIVADDGGFFAAYNSYCAANGCIQATAWRMSGATNGINTGQCALTGSPSGSCGGANGSVVYSELAGTYLFSYLVQRGLIRFTWTPGATVTLYVGWAMRYDLGGYLGYGAACYYDGHGENCS